MDQVTLVKKLRVLACMTRRRWGRDPSAPTIEDLMSVGYLTYRASLTTYDPTRKASVWTRAKQRVQFAMFDELCRESEKTSIAGHHGRDRGGKHPLPQRDRSFDIYTWGDCD